MSLVPQDNKMCALVQSLWAPNGVTVWVSKPSCDLLLTADRAAFIENLQDIDATKHISGTPVRYRAVTTAIEQDDANVTHKLVAENR